MQEDGIVAGAISGKGRGRGEYGKWKLKFKLGVDSRGGALSITPSRKPRKRKIIWNESHGSCNDGYANSSF